MRIHDEVTPRAIYRQRRALIGNAMALLAGTSAGFAQAASAAAGNTAAGLGAGAAPASAGPPDGTPLAATAGPFSIAEPRTPKEDFSGYSNFFEFGTNKDDPARHSTGLRTRPWQVQVDGEVERPRSFDIDELLSLAPLQERVYRLRCVEAWSMVVPWIGYPFAELARQVKPNARARFVAFESLADREQMPGVRSRVLQWPYQEGLRLDEALHPLTLLTLGAYGEVLPRPNGAPVRIVVPWKYGYKSPKAIVRIRFTAEQPPTSWNRAAPSEYGFYSNVNPKVAHPRWSQATERRIDGDTSLFTPKRPTLPFNGYADEVASLYAGMDLQRDR